MSSEASPDFAIVRRPLWLAALVGTVVPYLAGAMLIVGRVAWINPGERNAAALIEQFTSVMVFGAWIALPSAVLMLGLLLLGAETRQPKPLRTWLLAALAATTPVAIAVWLVSHLGDCFESCGSESSYLIAPLIVYGFGLLGGAVGWWVRYGRRRA